jgi:hypothetical protein
MRVLMLAVVLLGLSVFAEETRPKPKVQRHVLVELFTSQG